MGTDDQKNIDWIKTDNRLTAKTSVRSMVIRIKKVIRQWIDTICQKSIFKKLMINTIGQTSKIYNRYIDTISVKHDRCYRHRSFDYLIKIKPSL